MAELNDILEVKFVTSTKPPNRNLSVAFNILHYRVAAIAGSGASPKLVADTLSTNASTPYKALFVPESRYEGLLIQKIFPLPKEISEFSKNGQGSGSRTGDLLPLFTAGIITKRTALVGRRFRGRTFVPYPIEDDNSIEGNPTVAYLGLLNALSLVILTPAVYGGGGNTTSLVPCLFHPPPLPAPQFTDLVTTFSQPYWGEQRRRQNSFGNDTIPIELQ